MMTDNFIKYNLKKYIIDDIIIIDDNNKKAILQINREHITYYNFSEQLLDSFNISYIKYSIFISSKKINDDEYKIVFTCKLIEPENIVSVMNNGEYIFEVTLNNIENKNNKTSLSYVSNCINNNIDGDIFNILYNMIMDYLNNTLTEIVGKKLINNIRSYTKDIILKM